VEKSLRVKEQARAEELAEELYIEIRNDMKLGKVGCSKSAIQRRNAESSQPEGQMKLMNSHLAISNNTPFSS
jgi:hypothetical protein